MFKYLSFFVSLCSYLLFAQSGVGIFPKFDSINEKKIQIESYKDSKVIIFPKEFTQSLFADSIQTFTPDYFEVKKYLSNIERKNFKMWRRNYNWFYGNLKDMDQQAKKEMKEEKKHTIGTFKKIAGNKNTIIQVFGAFYQNQRLLSFQLLDFTEDPYDLKDVSHRSYIDGWHGWFETNRKIIIYNLDEHKVEGSWEIE